MGGRALSEDSSAGLNSSTAVVAAGSEPEESNGQSEEGESPANKARDARLRGEKRNHWVWEITGEGASKYKKRIGDKLGDHRIPSCEVR